MVRIEDIMFRNRVHNSDNCINTITTPLFRLDNMTHLNLEGLKNSHRIII